MIKKIVNYSALALSATSAAGLLFIIYLFVIYYFVICYFMLRMIKI